MTNFRSCIGCSNSESCGRGRDQEKLVEHDEGTTTASRKKRKLRKRLCAKSPPPILFHINEVYRRLRSWLEEHLPGINHQQWDLRVMVTLSLVEDATLTDIAYSKECCNHTRGFFVLCELATVVLEGEKAYYVWIDDQKHRLVVNELVKIRARNSSC